MDYYLVVMLIWRHRPELNRGKRLCRPLHKPLCHGAKWGEYRKFFLLCNLQGPHTPQSADSELERVVLFSRSSFVDDKLSSIDFFLVHSTDSRCHSVLCWYLVWVCIRHKPKTFWAISSLSVLDDEYISQVSEWSKCFSKAVISGSPAEITYIESFFHVEKL